MECLQIREQWLPIGHNCHSYIMICAWLYVTLSAMHYMFEEALIRRNNFLILIHTQKTAWTQWGNFGSFRRYTTSVSYSNHENLWWLYLCVSMMLPTAYIHFISCQLLVIATRCCSNAYEACDKRWFWPCNSTDYRAVFLQLPVTGAEHDICQLWVYVFALQLAQQQLLHG